MPAAVWRSPSTPDTTNGADRDTFQPSSWIPSSGKTFLLSSVSRNLLLTRYNGLTMDIGCLRNYRLAERPYRKHKQRFDNRWSVSPKRTWREFCHCPSISDVGRNWTPETPAWSNRPDS
jgi:hypothetical protein